MCNTQINILLLCLLYLLVELMIMMHECMMYACLNQAQHANFSGNSPFSSYKTTRKQKVSEVNDGLKV